MKNEIQQICCCRLQTALLLLLLLWRLPLILCFFYVLVLAFFFFFFFVCIFIVSSSCTRVTINNVVRLDFRFFFLSFRLQQIYTPQMHSKNSARKFTPFFKLIIINILFSSFIYGNFIYYYSIEQLYFSNNCSIIAIVYLYLYFVYAMHTLFVYVARVFFFIFYIFLLY